MLEFDGAWRFSSPGGIGPAACQAFLEYILKMTAQGDRQNILEHFKGFFAAACGTTHYRSSNSSWAQSDLEQMMAAAGENAPLFIEAFHDACETLRQRGLHVPDVGLVNRLLAEHRVPYELQPPRLVPLSNHQPVAPPERVLSLDETAQRKIHESLELSGQLLAEGRTRPAVQEILWLLETVSTAFQGMATDDGTVQGKYFNKIVGDLRRWRKGQLLEQALAWMTTLHGWLSSPTGGGIRHGADIGGEVDLDPVEARLYCNLIRSYIGYLLAEHERLSRVSNGWPLR